MRRAEKGGWTSEINKDLTRHPASSPRVATRRRSAVATASDHIRSPRLLLRKSRHRSGLSSRGSAGPRSEAVATNQIVVDETTPDISSWPMATHHSALSTTGRTTTSTTARPQPRQRRRSAQQRNHLPVDSRLDLPYQFPETFRGSRPRDSDASRLSPPPRIHAVWNGFDSRRVSPPTSATDSARRRRHPQR